MATDPIGIPPPPEGFILDETIPPPPAGFRLDPPENKPSAPTWQVGASAIARGGINLLNTPMAMADLVGHALLPPGVREKVPHLPNYPMKAAESIGLIDPAKDPQTPTQRVMDTAVQAGTQLGMMSGPGGFIVGAVSGGLSQITKELTGSELLAIAVGVASPFAFANRTPSLLTGTGKTTLKEAQEAGLRVQPSRVKPSAAINQLESIAGKAAVPQDVALRNAPVFDAIASKDLGLPQGTELTHDAIEGVRKQAGKVYEEIEALRSSPNMPWFPRFHSGNLLDQLKEARAQAKALYQSYYQSPVPLPQVRKEAEAASNLAQSLERDIENVAVAAGRKDLIERLPGARELIAKTYDVEKALLPDGHVSAQILGRMVEDGKPLTGGLDLIGRFAKTFPHAARDARMIPPPAVSGTNPAVSAGLGMLGYSTGGTTGAMIGAGLPYLRTPARNYALSKGLQARLLREPYQELGQAAGRGAIVGKTLLDYREEVTK